MARPLLSAAQIQALETRLATDGAPPAILMQRAGEALLRCLRANWPEARRVLVVVGPGNNGGDGYALARLLDARPDTQATIVRLAEPRASEARAAADAWSATGGDVDAWCADGNLPAADVIVDALFGVGLSRALEGEAKALVDAINDHPAPVLAVDLPSGMDADTGSSAGPVIRATRTLCLLARKRGLFTGRAADLTGAVDFADLGATSLFGDDDVDVDAAVEIVGRRSPGGFAVARLLERGDLKRWLPRRSRSAHKGDHGYALVAGGDVGMAGAVTIAGHAALRAGAGLVSIATRDAHAMSSGQARPEIMRHGVEDAGAFAALLPHADALAIGPGMGTTAWGRMLFDAALKVTCPIVFDADALNLLARSPRALGDRVVLTPHPGEAGRLLDRPTDAVEADRFAAARELARRFDCVVVLKGAGTIIDDGRRTFVCPFGNPGMASGGMGDALAGIVAGFMAQGLSAADAAAAGVLAHALAGDRAARLGERGVTASDLIECLRMVVNP
jgi:hydroxyethylthiazole kinase-like uncharacterized protein yjeF